MEASHVLLQGSTRICLGNLGRDDVVGRVMRLYVIPKSNQHAKKPVCMIIADG